MTPAKLTLRQHYAIHLIRQAGAQGITSDELGAHLHEYRQQQGGKGHHSDERCLYCGTEGASMGRALRKHGLVYARDNKHWTLLEHRGSKTTTTASSATSSGYDPRTAEIPF